MDAYKKRAKLGWNVGKGEKDSSNRSERTYIKKELAREIPISSEEEELSIKNEINADEYDRETFNEMINERPDLIKDIPIIKKKHKKKPTRKTLESRLAYFQQKIEALRPDGYGTGWLKHYYNENIDKLKKGLAVFKKDDK